MCPLHPQPYCQASERKRSLSGEHVWSSGCLTKVWSGGSEGARTGNVTAKTRAGSHGWQGSWKPHQMPRQSTVEWLFVSGRRWHMGCSVTPASEGRHEGPWGKLAGKTGHVLDLGVRLRNTDSRNKVEEQWG